MNRTHYATLALLVASGFFVRFVGLGTHFGHYDDLAVATIILEAKSDTTGPVEEIADDFKVNMPPAVKGYKESVQSSSLLRWLAIPEWVRNAGRHPRLTTSLSDYNVVHQRVEVSDEIAG